MPYTHFWQFTLIRTMNSLGVTKDGLVMPKVYSKTYKKIKFEKKNVLVPFFQFAREF